VTTAIHEGAPRERQSNKWFNYIGAMERIDDQNPEKQPDGNEKEDSVEKGNLLRAVEKGINT